MDEELEKLRMSNAAYWERLYADAALGRALRERWPEVSIAGIQFLESAIEAICIAYEGKGMQWLARALARLRWKEAE